MDILEIDRILDYKIDLSDPQILVDEIISDAQKYLWENVKNGIQKAYLFAKNAHKDQLRHSGEPYIIHPVKATKILMDLKPDLESIQTCLLHDVIEDCTVTKEEIEKEFGTDVANLCEWLVKVSKIKYKWEDRQLETIKKTFLAMAQDLRVIFVKLADRIHNMQTLQFHPKKEKRDNIANETMKIYVPIAKRLWLYHYQVILENACFKNLYPEDFEKIWWYLKKQFLSTDKQIKRWTSLITNMLKKEWVDNFEVKWRVKSPYRIWEKMNDKYHTTNISNVMDLLAFRVITDSISNCYTVLGIIHKYYTPLIKKIKDYIAVPKFNGYKSIHTTILGMFKFPVEIQIRTYEMDDIAEFGVAAHYAYSDKDSPNKVNAKQAEWMKKLQQLVNAYTESTEKEQFKDQLNIELLSKDTFIYTPKWDIIEIPKWSTVLDFAFHIHTEIWLRFKNAIVNWEIVPITYTPHTWDVVKINTFKYKYTANSHWTSILKTPSAKSKVMKFIKSEISNELLAASTKILDEKLSSFWLAPLNSKDDKISATIEKKELDRQLIEALDNKTIYNKLVKQCYPKEYHAFIKEKSELVSNYAQKEQTTQTHGIIIDGNKLSNYTICPECDPQNMEKIIAKTGRDGIKIHGVNCKALKTIAPGNLLEAHWEWQETNLYTIVSTVTANSSFNIINLLEIFTRFNIEINNFSIENTDDFQKKIITITWVTKSPFQMWPIHDWVKNLGNDVKIVKREIK